MKQLFVRFADNPAKEFVVALRQEGDVYSHEGVACSLRQGVRKDYELLPGMEGRLDAIGRAGNVGIGLSGRLAKQGLKAARDGRLEQMTRLRPVLSAISARAGSDYRTGTREMSKSLAFENQPVLQAAMEGELSGRINENAGPSSQTQPWMRTTARPTKPNPLDVTSGTCSIGRLLIRPTSRAGPRGSMYDRSRQGGLLQDMLRAGMGFASGGLTSALGSLSSSRPNAGSGGLNEDSDFRLGGW